MLSQDGMMPRIRPTRQLRVSGEIAGQLEQSILPGRFKAGAKLRSERCCNRQSMRGAKASHPAKRISRRGDPYTIDLP